MDISNQCRPGWGYPNFQKLNHGYLQQVRTRIGISQTSKIKSWISLICAEQIWYIPKTEKIYLWSAAIVWFIHGIACDNQRYPWYISKHWYIPGISLVYAKTRKLINGYQIPDDISLPSQVRLWQMFHFEGSVSFERRRGVLYFPSCLFVLLESAPTRC